MVQVWAKRDEEFLKRAAFSLLACLAWHDKHATDERFVALFPIIKNAARDERNFVKKAVNWALRNIGKRNRRLIHEAFQLAKEIQGMNSRAARWVAADAMRELERTVIRQKLVKRTKGQEVATIPKHNRHKTRSRRILHTPPSASRMILRSHHAASFPFLPC